MQKIGVLILWLLFGSSAYANHFTGGHLRYEYTGTPLLYRVQLTLYKTCESTAIDLPTFINIYAQSNKTGNIINKNLGRVTEDTLQVYCAGTATSCSNLSAPYPGYIAALYSDTVRLPVAADDWRFVFSNSNRALNIDNLQGASGQSFYIDAPLNLPGFNNSSALMADLPPHVLFVNDTVSIPLSATDADGDTVAYSLIAPEGATGSGLPYYAGYSASAPFGSGGLCYIKDNNTLVLKSTTVGKFTLALRMTEYRKSGSPGYTTRDFVIICVGSQPGNQLSIPVPATRNNLSTYTCPGRSNKLTLNFTDPNPADSVYMEIKPPVLPGFTFNTNVNNGIGAADGLINWTTPGSLNPATLPFFDIEVKLRDNSCKTIGKATYYYRVTTRACSADSVWPGDANSDKVVDMYDPLAIALTYQDTGSARPNASTSWVAQYCNYWDGSFLNNIDIKHADCNGDGIVDTADLAAIDSNYGQIHAKGVASHKTTAGADLYFNHSGISPNPDSNVSIKILLGTATAPVDKLYGFATNILVDGLALANPPEITYTANWIGNTTNTLSFIKNVSATSIDWAYARTDKQNVSGQGIIANLKFKIPATTPNGTLVTVSYNRTKLIDNNGLEITGYNALRDTFYVWYPVSITDVNKGIHNLRLFPNPSAGGANISLYTPAPYLLTISITDVTGKVQAEEKVSLVQGENIIQLPALALPAGIFLVKVSSKNAGFAANLKWVKQ